MSLSLVILAVAFNVFYFVLKNIHKSNVTEINKNNVLNCFNFIENKLDISPTKIYLIENNKIIIYHSQGDVQQIEGEMFSFSSSVFKAYKININNTNILVSSTKILLENVEKVEFIKKNKLVYLTIKIKGEEQLSRCLILRE
ncbi:hypothetical protein CPJCM30710_06280 [Clostridium polyendosporum]|uniref:Uncharacterized protein n=1 Tax=Clostridium polyendosporum TaxID=69208 RepID=A0A919VFB2_9CLOT|nr:hypothetical protein CPJCM30710_06280 [Clostridium polyendosporum]